MKSNLTLKLAAIQSEMKAKKSRYNGFGKYNYRAAEDILEAVKPFCVKHNVTVTVTEEMVSIEPPIMQSTASIIDGESDNAIRAAAIVGVDLLSKGMSMPQKYGAASSYAKKYALGNLFLIDDTKDADATNGLTMNKAAIDKAKDFVQAGGKLDAIKKKYNVTPEIEKQLTTL